MSFLEKTSHWVTILVTRSTSKTRSTLEASQSSWLGRLLGVSHCFWRCLLGGLYISVKVHINRVTCMSFSFKMMDELCCTLPFFLLRISQLCLHGTVKICKGVTVVILVCCTCIICILSTVRPAFLKPNKVFTTRNKSEPYVCMPLRDPLHKCVNHWPAFQFLLKWKWLNTESLMNSLKDYLNMFECLEVSLSLLSEYVPTLTNLSLSELCMT